MEGLHITMEDVVASGRFQGVNVGDSNFVLSHLFYVDDALFLGKWDERNIRNIITILRCFYMVYGLNINLFKSSLVGVGVDQIQVVSLASFRVV